MLRNAEMLHWHIELRNISKDTLPLAGFFLWRAVADACAAAIKSETAKGDKPTVIECNDKNCKPTFYRPLLELTAPVKKGRNVKRV